MMKSKVIRIDEDVWAELQRRARPFEDTPNTVLRRVLGLQLEMPASNENHVDNRVMKFLDLVEKEMSQKMPKRLTSSGTFPILSKSGKVFAYIYPQRKRLKVEVRKDWAEQASLSKWHHELPNGWFNTGIASVYWNVPDEDTESYLEVSKIIGSLSKLNVE